MLVRRKRSNKRKRKFYEALEIVECETSLSDVSVFLGNLGTVKFIKDNNTFSAWIEMKDGRRISFNQFLLRDERRERIISFDPTIFYEFYDIWSI